MNRKRAVAFCLVMLLGILLTTCRPPTSSVEVFGVGDDKDNWHVRIEGFKQPPVNPTILTVEPGDTIEWRVETGFHGVVFLNQSDTEVLLRFDPKVGLPRTDSPRDFGEGWWGTDGARGGTVLVKAKVRDASGVVVFTCVVHGTPDSASGRMQGVIITE